MLRSGALASRDVSVSSALPYRRRQVRTRNINPVGHTRLPRYARGKQGIVDRDHGVYVFPDTTRACARARIRSTFIRFVSPRASFGVSRLRRATRSIIDLWDDYLEPA